MSYHLDSLVVDSSLQLLEPEVDKRIDHEGVRAHKWFKGFEWSQIETETLPKVPIVPVCSSSR